MLTATSLFALMMIPAVSILAISFIVGFLEQETA